ncbi:Signal transduction histidine kinase [Paucidesulfovibrio gracilis DSM 16080]|uniref:histidine kinase n=1 Tax=Paucidesulfovibrio gracilis DSM 16080 TaxID=1121449 RepID=A0A1T4Y7V2_9BACT|nr:response regulator [Paucidesulfovibrio gracilis]SKA97763.1 Signal transduction histidine kinase [Paucidesulfovibrio gracilis DSM 16080]
MLSGKMREHTPHPCPAGPNAPGRGWTRPRNPARWVRLGLVLVGLVLSWCMPMNAMAQQEPVKVSESRVIRVGVYDNRPIIFPVGVDGAGGFFVDVLESVAQRQGWRLQYVHGTWANVFAAVKQGKIDLLPAVAHEESRESFLSFSSRTLLTNWGQIYARRGLNVQSLLDIDGLVLGVLDGDTHAKAIQNLLDEFGISYAVVRFSSYEDLLRGLEDHVADVGGLNRIYGTKNAWNYRVSSTPVVYNPIELRFAAPAGDPAGVLPALDTAVSAMMRDKDSTYHQSQARWFGGVPSGLPAWVLPVSAGAGLLVMLLAGMNMLMRRRIADRTAELVQARDAAQTASRAKSRFLANMSHEVRTPLNGLLGMLQILRDTPLNGEQQEFVDTALHSGRSLLSVINDVLDLSKIESGSLEVSEEAFCPRAMINSVRDLFQEEARKKGVRLSVHVSPDMPDALLGDAGKWRQILFNLVGNAVKFTHQGSVDVEAALLDGSDNRQSSSSDRHMIRLEVRDTGIGIDPDLQDKCFEPFCQLDASPTRAYGGAGLGLSIVRRLVDIMEGQVSFRSEPGWGTAAEVLLPARVAPAMDQDPCTPDPSQPATEPRGLRVLVAEDNRVNRLAMRRFLEGMGHTVLEAGNGREALDTLALQEVDCVLMDVQMPVMDGTETTLRIRAGELGTARRSLPVVAVTAHAMKGDRESFLAAGMDDYLAKPVDRKDLRQVLARLFGSGRSPLHY